MHSGEVDRSSLYVSTISKDLIAYADMRESGDNNLHPSPEVTEIGDEGLSSCHCSEQCSESEPTDSGEVDLCPTMAGKDPEMIS